MGLFSSKCNSSARLDGKVVVITGANTGIGKECAKDFYLRGGHVLMACRSARRAGEALNDIKQQCKDKTQLGRLDYVHLDLADLKSVRKCAREIIDKHDKVDVLLNNAGIMACPEARTLEGFEMQFGTNHLGHFLFTLLLLQRLTNSPDARIVNVSSLIHTSGRIDFEDLNWNRKPYDALSAYKQSKLANILFTKELARKLREKGIANVNTYSLNPGIISTELSRHFNDTIFSGSTFLFNALSFLWKTPYQGAQTSVYCCVSEEAATETGLYYNECKVAECSSSANNADDAKKLWECSLDLVKLLPIENPLL